MLFATAAGAAEAQPSAPWWLSIATAVVAVLALLLSAVTLRQTWKRDHPKVHWIARWDDGGAGYELLSWSKRFLLTQRGPGVARDVRLEAEVDGKVTTLRNVPKMEFNESTEALVCLNDEEVIVLDEQTYMTHVRWGLVVGHQKVKLKLTWSHLPDLHKRRSKRWTHKPKWEGSPR